MNEGREGERKEGAREGRNWKKKKRNLTGTLLFTLEKSLYLWELQLLYLQNRVDKTDFLTDTLIADLNVPCKLYSMMQYMIWYFTWHHLPVISPFIHSVIQTFILQGLSAASKYRPMNHSYLFCLEAFLIFSTQGTNSQFLTAFVCLQAQKAFCVLYRLEFCKTSV